MPTSGVDAPPEAVAALYAEFDADHSGSVSYAELTQQLRDEYCATPELPEQQGAPRVRFELRKGAERGLSPARTPESMPPQLGHFCKLDVDWGFDEGGGFEYLELTGDTLQEKLRAALKKGWCRVKDLFVSWDSSSDGTVSRHEFAEAMRVLGLHAPAEAIDGIFCSFDPESSGMVRLSPRPHLRLPSPPPSTPPSLSPPLSPSPLPTPAFALVLTFALTFALSISLWLHFTAPQSTSCTGSKDRSAPSHTQPFPSPSTSPPPSLPPHLRPRASSLPSPSPHSLSPPHPLCPPCVGRLRANAQVPSAGATQAVPPPPQRVAAHAAACPAV